MNYWAYECSGCEGSGVRYDPTNADKIGVTEDARSRCGYCSGQGFKLFLAGSAGSMVCLVRRPELDS